MRFKAKEARLHAWCTVVEAQTLTVLHTYVKMTTNLMPDREKERKGQKGRGFDGKK